MECKRENRTRPGWGAGITTDTVTHFLIDVLPQLAAELASQLRAQGEDSLADSVPGLCIVDRCRCGDEFCATFYTEPRPKGAYRPSHRNVVLEPAEGMLSLDVVDDRIACVEVLYRPAIRSRVLELVP